jgi:hypothetical protein
MACTVWTLVALTSYRESRGRASAAKLLVMELVGLASRVSFIPMLAMPALLELTDTRALRARLASAARASVLFGVLPAVVFFGAAHALGFEHVRDAWRWAHESRFVSATPLHDFARSVVLAGGVYLILGVLGSGAPGRAQSAFRVHLVWVFFYLLFLTTGRGSLWPRYFLPIVPSILIVTAPALARLAAVRTQLAWGLVTMLALWGLRSAVVSTDDPRQSLALLAGDVVQGRSRAAASLGSPLGAAARARLAVSVSQSMDDASLMIDGRPDTAWTSATPLLPGVTITIDLGKARHVVAIVLAGDPSPPLEDIAVQGSRDGRTWQPLDAQVVASGFFTDRVAGPMALRLPGGKLRHIRLVTTARRDEPWVVRELDVRVARRMRREGDRLGKIPLR